MCSQHTFKVAHGDFAVVALWEQATQRCDMEHALHSSMAGCAGCCVPGLPAVGRDCDSQSQFQTSVHPGSC